MILKNRDIAIIVGLAIAVVFSIIIFPSSNLFIKVPVTQAGNVNISPNIQNGPITTGSIVNATAIYTQAPTTTAVQNALDSLGCKDNNGICAASSQKFLINTQIVVFDSNQKQYPSSVFTNIPPQSFLGFGPKVTITDYKNNKSYTIPQISTPLSLVDAQNPNRLLDLGSVQLSMYGATSVDSNVVVGGQFAVYLDDILRYQGNVATQGNTVNKLIPLQIGSKPAFTFTFADEGKNWVNGTTHYFKVYVGNVTASVGTGVNTQTFQYSKNALVYVLAMTLNSNTKVMLGADNQAVAVLKNDDTINICGKYDTVNTQTLGTQGTATGISYYVSESGGYGVPLTTASINGFVIGQINPISNNLGVNGVNAGENAGYIYSSAYNNSGKQFCGHMLNVPRNSIILLQIGTKQMTLQTALTQSDINIDANSLSVSGASVLQ